MAGAGSPKQFDSRDLVLVCGAGLGLVGAWLVLPLGGFLMLVGAGLIALALLIG